MGSSKGGSDVEYTQSPEQAQLYQMMMPLAYQIFGYTPTTTTGTTETTGTTGGKTGNTTDSSGITYLNGGKTGTDSTSTTDYTYTGDSQLWDIPSIPDAPTATSMSGVYSGVSPVSYSGYDVSSPTIGTYETPDVSSIMPTEGWYSGLDESIKAALEEPYNEARSTMFETLGTNIGSATGGFSGAAAAALGEFEATKASELGTAAWEILSPSLMANYEAQLGLSQDIFNAQTNADLQTAASQTGANQYLTDLQNTQSSLLRSEVQQEQYADYTNALSQEQQDYTNALTEWEAQLEQNTFPYTALLQLMGGTYSNPVVTDSTNYLGSIGSGLSNFALMSAIPEVGTSTALLSGLGGLLGSK